MVGRGVKRKTPKNRDLAFPLRDMSFDQKSGTSGNPECTNNDSNVAINSVSSGTSRSTFTVDRGMCNGGDTLHGGFIAACVDVLSTFSHLGSAGKIAWTMGLNVDFITAAHIGDQITVETSVLRQGHLPLVEACFKNSNGALVARGTTTLLNGSDKYQKLVKDTYNFDPEDK